MKAITMPQAGPPEVLTLSEVPDPHPEAGQVVIESRATALNRADLLQRQGKYPPPTGAPPYLGLEVAGRILEVGLGVTEWRVGDRVMALLGGGGYAEQVAVPQETLLPIPEGMSWAEAAALPEAWLTAYSNLIEIGRLEAGERVLVHAGASGVGTAAIQLARWRGATVFATASAPKLPALQALGVTRAIDYRNERFAEVILAETDGRGVDVILDFIGAPYWDDNLRTLAPWGRLVLVGLMGGREVKANLGLFLSKKLSVHGSTLRDRTLEQKARLVQAFRQEVLPSLASGALRPVLDPQQFRLDEAAAAHRYMEENRNIGKVILVIGSDEQT